MRVWDFDTDNRDVMTRKRVEYSRERLDELALVRRGGIVPLP